jgi:hypothetical protein
MAMDRAKEDQELAGAERIPPSAAAGQEVAYSAHFKAQSAKAAPGRITLTMFRLGLPSLQSSRKPGRSPKVIGHLG